jgi:hypothetical protein
MNESAPLPSMVDDQGSSWKLLAHETEQIVVSMAHDLGAYEVYDFSEYDNNCFMRAVAFGLFGEPDHSRIRRELYDFARINEFLLLEDSGSVFGSMSPREWAQFQQSILADGEFNSSFSLQLLSYYLNQHVDGPIGLTIIYVSNASPDRNWIQSPHSPCTKQVVLASKDENHWVTLRKKNDPHPRRVALPNSLFFTVAASSSSSRRSKMSAQSFSSGSAPKPFEIKVGIIY